MILKDLSALWAAIAPPLGNHLWQSTLFAVAAGLLTLILRRNHARTRYWLWLAASVKFLIPFSLLIAIASHLTPSHGSAGTNFGLYFAMEEVGQPFTQPAMPAVSRAVPATVSPNLLSLLPALLAAAWLCGIVVVFLVWHARWRRISAAMRQAAPLREGREVEALRRLERMGGIRKRIEMLLSPASLEPGIFGIIRPVLVWPQGISRHLEDAHLEAILAHEVWHVRRRDNLTAAIHMVVEAVFWFHPLVWWLGARLVEERERACDEEVLELGGERQVYAESILKVCEFCVGSSLSCVAGVTGADLKKRMVHIMTKSVARKLDFSRKLLLSVAGVLAVAVPIVFGLIRPAQSRAESQAQEPAAVAPVYQVTLSKPEKSGIYRTRMMLSLDGFTARAVTLQDVIRMAYEVEDQQIAGAPDWLNSERFDIEGKPGGPAAKDAHGQGAENRRALQALLADRFKLSLHRETRDLPGYALVIAPNGPRLQPAKPGDTYPNGFKDPDGRNRAGMMHMEQDQLTAQGVPVSELAGSLTRRLGRIVLDKTGLTDHYDFTLHWTAAPNAPPESSRAAILAALQEQLGLKLESQTVPRETLVIDHVEKLPEPQAMNAAATAGAYEVVVLKVNKTGDPMPPFNIVGRPARAVMINADRFRTTNMPLQRFIRVAYGVVDDQITGGPDWLNSENYDIDAKPDQAAIDALQKLSPEQRGAEARLMLRAFLAERFKLSLHRETRELPVYVLSVAENGPRFHEATPGNTYSDGVRDGNGRILGPGLWQIQAGHITCQGDAIVDLVDALERLSGGHVVLDKTALTGKYDFTLQWTPKKDGEQESTRSSLIAALHEQLGLKLEPQKAPVEVLVIDHAGKPVEKEGTAPLLPAGAWQGSAK
ncbi:MAG: TIGR03435 family protein [Acidobacteriia bacterium]|nr:TIGR03435 family protein [Terriglobia bacterium]